MKSNQNNTINIELNFTGLIFIVFLILKLTNTINWSWWWVFSPVWIPIAIVIMIFLIAFIINLFDD